MKEKNAPAGISLAGRLVTAAVFVLVIAANAFLCLYLGELISRGSRSSALAWMFNNPGLYAAAFSMIFFSELFLAALFNRPGAGLLAGNLVFLLPAVINHYKLALRGEWFLLPDLMAANVALQVLPGYEIRVTPLLAFSLALLLVIFPAAAGFRRMLPGGRVRIFSVLLTLGAAACAFVFGLSVPLSSVQLPDQLYNNGGVYRALYETRPRRMKAPEGYSRESVLSLLKESGQDSEEKTGAEGIRPDLFFIMSESLFDLVSLGGIEASADPLDALRALQAEYAGCAALCHSYGGGTFDAEYEVLTGYRSADTPGNLSADDSAVRPGMETLVTALRALGYETLAVHPNDGGAYRRRRNYACFGFERTLFREDLPAFSHTVGNYPADDELMDRVIEAYDARDPNRPFFCHVVTFQNHGGYAYAPDRQDIRVWNREGREKTNAENYLNGVLSHIEAVEKLLARLSGQSRPAVVLLWGDHAPNMGNFGVETGSGAASARFYETPVLLWNNYGADLSFGEEAVAMYRLGACTLQKLGLCADPYFRCLAEEGTPDQLTPLRLLEEDGRFFRDDALYGALNDQLYLLHYDRLLGENYGREAGK